MYQSRKRYLYFEYFEDGTTKQKYCGPDGSDSGRLKALELEYEYVQGKRDALNERLNVIKAEMKKISMTILQTDGTCITVNLIWRTLSTRLV